MLMLSCSPLPPPDRCRACCVSQDAAYGGDTHYHSNSGEIQVHDGKIYLNIPPQCTLMLRQVA